MRRREIKVTRERAAIQANGEAEASGPFPRRRGASPVLLAPPRRLAFELEAPIEISFSPPRREASWAGGCRLAERRVLAVPFA